MPVSKEHFTLFRQERIRDARDFEDIMGERVYLKEIIKAYKRWALENNKDSLKPIHYPEFKKLCDDAFGESRDPLQSYHHMRVFLNEEDVEEFDKEHTETFQEQIANVLTEPPKPDHIAIQNTIEHLCELYAKEKQEHAITKGQLQAWKESFTELNKKYTELEDVAKAVGEQNNQLVEILKDQGKRLSKARSSN